MGFQKIILTLPVEGYTGETVEHKVTAANLKNQPELVEAGIKLGDTIKVIPQSEEPAKGEKPADKSGDALPSKDGESKPNKSTESPTPAVKPDPVLSSSDDTNTDDNSESKSNKRAAEIAEQLGVEKVFENKVTGEFFTSENLVLLSVKHDKNKVKTHNF